MILNPCQERVDMSKPKSTIKSLGKIVTTLTLNFCLLIVYFIIVYFSEWHECVE